MLPLSTSTLYGPPPNKVNAPVPISVPPSESVKMPGPFLSACRAAREVPPAGEQADAQAAAEGRGVRAGVGAVTWFELLQKMQQLAIQAKKALPKERPTL
jgi:hypothetical protein